MTNDANQRGPATSRHPDHFMAEWRDYRGYGVRELAKAVHVSHSKISRIENGESELRPGFARKIAEFFNIPLAALFTVNPQGAGRTTAQMLDIWTKIDPRDHERAIRSLSVFAKDDDASEAG